ncbi:hypothetical protein MGA3_16838 [Bacillus methanolicus MGA3]|uniref:Uncharacterized protein n=1 Tax=Bacillus methanolicus (strain MGA3 / ATCC 53907) TaxID=796606 RepID=I3DTZ2_BACMM|nr:hypothetical protein BMMGA3_01535 [Bacillus methanolicus MGA3]EIJ77713.1 hypothetical protein MGA3_16838 [Bacillus methanolicus MGA3]
MFDFKGFLKTISIPLVYLIIAGLILGFLNVRSVQMIILLLFIPSYLFTGIFSPYWNSKTPYFSSYLSSLTLSFLNILSGQYLFGFDTLTNSEGVNRALVFSTSFSLMITYLFLIIRKKNRKRETQNV